MEQKVTKKTRKLVNTVEALQAQNELLKHENNNLRSTVIEEKKQRTRGRGLFEKMRDEQESKSLIFSPNKIQQAHDLFIEKDRQDAQERLQKDTRKVEQLSSTIGSGYFAPYYPTTHHPCSTLVFSFNCTSVQLQWYTFQL